MLFKVWTTEHFADEPDRIGVIAAASLDNAVEKLKAWLVESLAGSSYAQLGDVQVTEGLGYASVISRTRDVDGKEGQDYYALVPHEGPLMFIAEDWRELFS